MSGEGGRRRRGEEGGRIVDECLEPAETGRGKGPSTLRGFGHCFFYYQIFSILLYVTNYVWVYYIVGPPEADSSEPVLNMI